MREYLMVPSQVYEVMCMCRQSVHHQGMLDMAGHMALLERSSQPMANNHFEPNLPLPIHCNVHTFVVIRSFSDPTNHIGMDVCQMYRREQC
jgi:hypothetical protein